MDFKFETKTDIRMSPGDREKLEDSIICFKLYKPGEVSFVPLKTIMEKVDTLIQAAFVEGGSW